MGANPSSIDHIITNMTFLFTKSFTVETGIFDHHKLITSICRMTFAKGKNKKFLYCCFKSFESKIFEEIWDLEDTFRLTLEKFASLKLQNLGHNNCLFMNKTLRSYNLDRTAINFENYQKQWNICAKLFQKSKT